MSAAETQFIRVGSGQTERRIATLATPARTAGGAGLFWLIGLKSDMVSTKAEALAAYAARHGLACTRFDYSGHGQSGGDFEQATLSDWVEEAEAVFTRVATGPQILMGSSTGAHVALLLLRRLMEQRPLEAQRIKALVLVAPAWDLTELMWGELPEAARREILEKGRWVRPSQYGEGYPITRAFIEDGRKHLFAGQDFDPRRPVLVLQGAQDVDVPLEYALKLEQVLNGGWVETTVVPDGEHRLSRPQDIAMLEGLIGRALKSTS